jgi:hypothetical protein
MTMMLLAIFVVLAIGLSCLWLAQRSHILRGRKEECPSALRGLDIPAFHNLVRADDDRFLKSVLTAGDYHRAKRIRTRAMQQYLLWIAGDCSIVQRSIRAEMNLHGEAKASVLTSMSMRLRVTALMLWGMLWLQWALPFLDMTPASILNRYDDWCAIARKYLTSGSEALGRQHYLGDL